MFVTIINPNIVAQKGDFFGTGIPYMPVMPAYLASYLLSNKHHVEVIDAFGERPSQRRREGDLIISGLVVHEVISRINHKTDLICVYAGHVIEHSVIIQLIKAARKHFHGKKLLVFENSQAVTAYSLKIAHEDFLKDGCDYVVYGDPEETVDKIVSKRPPDSIAGLIYLNDKKIIINKPVSADRDIDNLPFPAWDLFPIRNYWKLGYAHVPYKKRYLPLLTSRGCPYQCEFCIIPFTNRRRWRARNAQDIVDEINALIKRYDVREFHIEDLNPTLDRKRIDELCETIIRSGLDITFKFASGIKLETIDKDSLDLLYRAGCRYISFSPESGSDKVLKLMKKPFDHKHGIQMTRHMSKLGIITQACFVLGFPGERKDDLELTKDYALRLTRAGVDEIAFFVMTPIPGSRPYELSQMTDLSKLTFSPRWRKEYDMIHDFRKGIYINILMTKLITHPLKALKHPVNLLSRRFETKIEMTIYRLLKTHS